MRPRLRGSSVFLTLLLHFGFWCSAGLVEGCRWALYAGKEEHEAGSLFSYPSHSLIRQSYSPPYLPDIHSAVCFDPEKNLVRNHEVNQDGWGVGWYEYNGTEQKTRRVRSGNGATRNSEGTPDPELEGLLKTKNVSSKVIFGHIRAATDGDLNQVNAHPFQFHKLLWMHNGGVANKTKVMGEARCGDKDLVYGDTDSEYAGALFTSFLTGDICSREEFELHELEEAMVKTVQQVQGDNECGPGIKGGSSLNFAVTDGVHVVVTRYRTCPDEEPPSLYYALDNDSLWASSEPLDDVRADGRSMSREVGEMARRQWKLVAKDQMLSYDTKTGQLFSQCLSKSCLAELQYRRSVEIEKFWRMVEQDFLGEGLGDDQCETER